MTILPSAFALPNDMPLRLERAPELYVCHTVADLDRTAREHEIVHFERCDYDFALDAAGVLHTVTEGDCRQPKAESAPEETSAVPDGAFDLFVANYAGLNFHGDPSPPRCAAIPGPEDHWAREAALRYAAKNMPVNLRTGDTVTVEILGVQFTFDAIDVVRAACK
jgi:hypothetical protein